MAKCKYCNSCLKARNIEEKLYFVCKLCKKIYYPPRKSAIIFDEIDESLRQELLTKMPDINIID